jgi:hypothetical protein
MSPSRPRPTVIAKAADLAVFSDLGTFFVAATPWVFLTALAHAIFVETFTEEGLAQTYGFMALQLSCSVPFLVSWHRRVLKGEPLSPLQMLRFDSRDWRFFLTSVAVLGIGLAPLIVLAPVGYLFVSNQWPGVDIVVIWIAFIILISIVFTAIKLSLAFPMAALDSARGAIKEAFRLSRGQEWTLAIALFLTIAPLWAVQRGLKNSVESLWSYPETYPLGLALYFVALLGGYLSLALIASAASFAYLAIAQSKNNLATSTD